MDINELVMLCMKILDSNLFMANLVYTLHITYKDYHVGKGKRVQHENVIMSYMLIKFFYIIISYFTLFHVQILMHFSHLHKLTFSLFIG